MLIDDMVRFCHEAYSGTCCKDCHNGELCDSDCKNCLDDLHFHHNKIRNNYCCERLLDFYICRYSYKYCSEIIYALESIDLSAYPFFHILSLGCGGAADLMAFDYLGYSQDISYVGFDKNHCWKKIHAEIVKRYTSGKVSFYRGVDVLSYFKENIISQCNIISIEYLISFFFSTVGENGVKEWFKQLLDQVITHKPENSPLLVIINDVDSINTGRDTFLLLRSIIEDKGLTVSFEWKKRFKDVAYYPGSIQYASRQNKFQIPQYVKDNYCPAINCESAQLILEVSQ